MENNKSLIRRSRSYPKPHNRIFSPYKSSQTNSNFAPVAPHPHPIMLCVKKFKSRPCPIDKKANSESNPFRSKKSTFCHPGTAIQFFHPKNRGLSFRGYHQITDDDMAEVWKYVWIMAEHNDCNHQKVYDIGGKKFTTKFTRLLYCEWSIFGFKKLRKKSRRTGKSENHFHS